MKKRITCPYGGHTFDHSLPRVERQEAEKLKENDDETALLIRCPHCRRYIPIMKRELLDLPDAP